MNIPKRLVYKHAPETSPDENKNGLFDKIVLRTKKELKNFKNAIDRSSVHDVMEALGEKVSRKNIVARREYLKNHPGLLKEINLRLKEKNKTEISESAENYTGSENQNIAFVEALKTLQKTDYIEFQAVAQSHEAFGNERKMNVAWESLPYRTQKGFNAVPEGHLTKGQEVIVTNRDGNWLEAKHPQSGEKIWIWGGRYKDPVLDKKYGLSLVASLDAGGTPDGNQTEIIEDDGILRPDEDAIVVTEQAESPAEPDTSAQQQPTLADSTESPEQPDASEASELPQQSEQPVTSDTSELPQPPEQPVAPKTDQSQETIPPDNQSVKAQHIEAVPESLNSPEIIPWNKEITLTFDDALGNSLNVIKHLESRGVKNYRFYGIAYPAIKNSVLKDMKVDTTNHTSEKITPGLWLTDYVDKQRGYMSRTEYIRKNMLKSEEDGKNGQTDYLKLGKEIKDFYQKKYPDNWKEKLQEKFQYHGSFLHPDPKSKFHIQHWSKEQIKEDIKFYQEFVKAWLDIDDYKVSHLRPPVGAGFGFDVNFYKGQKSDTSNASKLIEAARELNPESKWDLWRTDSFDALTQGGKRKRPGMTIENAAADIVKNRKNKKGVNPYEPDEALMLFHTPYYGNAAENKRLDQFIDAISEEYSKKEVMYFTESQQFDAKVKGPSTKLWSEDGKELAKLQKGEKCLIIGEKGDGYFVKSADGKKGLVAKKMLESAESISNKYNLPSKIQGKEVVYQLGEWTPAKINSLLENVSSSASNEERMMKIYQAFKDTPYKKQLEASLSQGYGNLKVVEPFKDKLVIRLDSMDCTEFPVYALALMNSRNYEEFVENLIKIKYKGGVIDDANKIHYTFMKFEDWNQKHLVENTMKSLPDSLKKKDSRASTTIANRLETKKRDYEYIPTQKIAEAASYLKTGDVFGFVLSDAKNESFGTKNGVKREQIIGHMGFVYKEGNELYFIHSNSSRYNDGTQAGISICEKWDGPKNKLIKGTKRTIADYIKQNGSYKGIIVMRPTKSSTLVASGQ